MKIKITDDGASDEHWKKVRDALALLAEGQVSISVSLAAMGAMVVVLSNRVERLTQEEQRMSESITDYHTASLVMAQAVAKNDDVVGSVLQVLSGYREQLDAELAKFAAAEATKEEDLAGFRSMRDQMAAKASMMASAVVAGTKAAPNVTPEEVAQTPDEPVPPAPDAPAEAPTDAAPTPDSAPTGDAPTDVLPNPALEVQQPAPEIDQTTGQPVPPTDATA